MTAEAKKERKRIVAWLRDRADSRYASDNEYDQLCARALRNAADAIERGEATDS